MKAPGPISFIAGGSTISSRPLSAKHLSGTASSRLSSANSTRFSSWQLEKLGDKCFQDTGLEEIVVPAGVTTIGSEAFRGCWKLRSASFQKGGVLEEMGESCFQKSGLEEFAVPSSVKKIGAKAFADCTRLTKVSFKRDSRLESIGRLCFHNTGILAFCAPASLLHIGAGAFVQCKELRRVELNEGLKEIDVASQACPFAGSGV